MLDSFSSQRCSAGPGTEFDCRLRPFSLFPFFLTTSHELSRPIFSFNVIHLHKHTGKRYKGRSLLGQFTYNVVALGVVGDLKEETCEEKEESVARRGVRTQSSSTFICLSSRVE